MPREDVRFTGVHGGELSGVLEVPDGPAEAWALFAHCFTCGKDSLAASRIGRALARRGIGVLRYDFTGLGESGGDFVDATFSSDVDNLVAAADVLRERGDAPGLLVGHSLGGAAVIAAADRIPEVKAVATINAPAHPDHVGHVFDEAADELAAQGQASVRIGGRSFTVRQELLDDLGGQAQQDRVASLDAALLVLHAPADEVVGVADAGELFGQARHPKSFVALDGADHLLSSPADSQYAADVIAAWASRYLLAEEPGTDEEPTVSSATATAAATGTTPANANGAVVVRETGDGPFVQQVHAGRHTWLTDEPSAIPGGTDAGPTPYDQLLAGLGACTAMTLRMYATRKELPLERVSVTLTQQRVHGDDLSASVDGGEDCVRQFTREVTLEGDLTDEQCESLLRIADRCPVHRTIEGGVQVVTTLAT